MSRNKNHKAALDWAPGEPPSGEECYWARFDYLKLRETLEAIVSAMETTAKEDQLHRRLNPPMRCGWWSRTIGRSPKRTRRRRGRSRCPRKPSRVLFSGS